MAVGAPLCALAFYALFTPPPVLHQAQAALWFGATFILYSIFHTLYALPHYALGPELTLDYHERSRLFGVREAFTILGTIAASIAPGVLIDGFHLSERRAFSTLGAAMAILLVVLYGLLVLVVRERPDFVARESNPFVPGVRRALRNRPFRILLLTYVVGSIAGAIPGTLMPFFNAYVIRPENQARWLATFLATYFASGFLCLPIWVLLARRFGKRPTWLASFVMGITGGAAMFFLGQGDTIPLLILIAWAGSSFGAGLFLGPAMQADVIDYDELHTGKRREAQYTAFWAMLPKFVAIPSAAIPIAILGSIGYVPNAVQTPQVVLAIKAIFALTPALCSTLAFFIAWRFAIDEGVHRAILQGHRAAPAWRERDRSAHRGRAGAARRARRRRGHRLVPRPFLAARADPLSASRSTAHRARRLARGGRGDGRVSGRGAAGREQGHEPGGRSRPDSGAGDRHLRVRVRRRRVPPAACRRGTAARGGDDLTRHRTCPPRRRAVRCIKSASSVTWVVAESRRPAPP